MQLTLSLSHQWSPRQTQTLEFGTHVQFIHTHSHSHSHWHTFRSRHLVCVCVSLCLNKFPYTTSTQAHLQFVSVSSCTLTHTHAIPHNHTSNGVCPMFVYVCVCDCMQRRQHSRLANEWANERNDGKIFFNRSSNRRKKKEKLHNEIWDKASINHFPAHDVLICLGLCRVRSFFCITKRKSGK